MSREIKMSRMLKQHSNGSHKSNGRPWLSNKTCLALGLCMMLLMPISLWSVIADGAATTHAAVSTHVSTVSHPPITHAAVAVHSINPHLHAVAAAAAPAVAETAAAVHHSTHIHELVAALSHHGWHYRWSYHTWVAAHRGVGMVEGYVYDSSGRPLPNARVVLKWPKGKAIAQVARRHITHTNAYGAFVMRGVRAGNYRVVAIKAKQRAHVLMAVHTGNISAVEIKI